MIEQLLNHYKKIQSDLAQNHHGEFVLIHGSEVIGFYPTAKDAYWFAVDGKKLEPGKFLIRECLTPEEERPLTFYSRLV